jgi:hypothetical protein
MSNTYTWDCKTVDVYPTYESESDVVYNVHWRITGTSDQQDAEGNNYTASSYGTESLSLSDIGSNFIPFADLTNAITTGWVETAIGEEGVNNIKDGINVNIEEQINPTTETKTIT